MFSLKEKIKKGKMQKMSFRKIFNKNQTRVDRDKAGIRIWNYGAGMTQGYLLDQSLSLRFI